jgi:hypothetical protein
MLCAKNFKQLGIVILKLPSDLCPTVLVETLSAGGFFLFRQRGVEHRSSTTHPAFHLDGTEGAVQLASAAFHTGQRTNEFDNAAIVVPISGKNSMRANIHTHTATGAQLGVEF